MAQPEHETRLPPLAWAGIAFGSLALAATHVRISVLVPDAARFSFDSAEYALAGRAWLETGRLVTPFVHPAALGISPGPPYPLLVGPHGLPSLAIHVDNHELAAATPVRMKPALSDGPRFSTLTM